MTTLELARQYGIEDGIELGMERGMQLGMERGMERERKKAEAEKRSIALKLKEMGLPTADIFKVVGLNIQENERL